MSTPRTAEVASHRTTAVSVLDANVTTQSAIVFA